MYTVSFVIAPEAVTTIQYQQSYFDDISVRITVSWIVSLLQILANVCELLLALTYHSLPLHPQDLQSLDTTFLST